MKQRIISTCILLLLFIATYACGSKTNNDKKEPKKDSTNEGLKNDTTKEITNNNSTFDPNASPENVVKTMIEAGKTGKYDQLSKLCNPAIDSDGDSKDVCSLADGKAKEGDKKGYNDFFGNATIKGSARIKGNMAEVDIKTTAEGGDEETIVVEQKDGKWYLKSF